LVQVHVRKRVPRGTRQGREGPSTWMYPLDKESLMCSRTKEEEEEEAEEEEEVCPLDKESLMCSSSSSRAQEEEVEEWTCGVRRILPLRTREKTGRIRRVQEWFDCRTMLRAMGR